MQNIIEIIEKQLQAYKDDISFKDWQIKDLKEQLEKAKKDIEILKAASQRKCE